MSDVERLQALIERGCKVSMGGEDGLHCVWIWAMLDGPDAFARGKQATLGAALAEALDSIEATLKPRQRQRSRA